MQKHVLQKRTNSKLLKKVHNDSASMAVLLDQSSVASERTANTMRSSICERIFDFDNELLSHPRYQETFRRLMRHAKVMPLQRSQNEEPRSVENPEVSYDASAQSPAGHRSQDFVYPKKRGQSLGRSSHLSWGLDGPKGRLKSV